MVGAGRRAREIYLPILRAQSESFRLVGLVSRSRSSAECLASAAAVPAFDSVSVLCRETGPDLLIAAVSADGNASIGFEIARARRAALLETPLALNTRVAHRLGRALHGTGRPVGVAEQKAFLPHECFKQMVIQAGAVGRVAVVENDFRSRSYHAVAQLRRYLPSEALPTWVRSTRAVSPLPAFIDSQGEPRPPGREEWKLAHIVFTDGSVAMHHASTAFKVAPFRHHPSLRVYGSRGSIVGDSLAVADASGRTVFVHADVRSGPSTEQIGVRLPDEREIVWRNPVAEFGYTDDQVAVALHLVAMRDAIRDGAPPLYGIHDALVDLDILDAMERSEARGGAPVFIRHKCSDPGCRPMSIAEAAAARLTQAARALAGIGPFHRWLRTGRTTTPSA